MSGLTLDLAIERLPDEAKPPENNDAAAQRAKLINAINRVQLRFVDSGKWEGTWQQARISTEEHVQTGGKMITLPRTLKTCLAGGKSGVPMPVQSEWYQYLQGGRGIRQEDEKHWGPLQDMGKGFVTYKDFTGTVTLKVVTTQDEGTGSPSPSPGDEAPRLLLKGTKDGKKIYSEDDGKVVEGIFVELDETPVTTSQEFDALYGVVKGVTQGEVHLYSVKAGEETQIASYEPGERVPDYRRYLAGGTYDEVQGLFKRKHVWVTGGNDELYPDNLEALKMGLFAINYEERNDAERAMYFWGVAFELLNAELDEYTDGSRPPMQLQPESGGGSISYIN